MLGMTLLVAQLHALSLGACYPDGGRVSCYLANCAIAWRYCDGGVLTPCECAVRTCDDGNPCTTDSVTRTQTNAYCTHTIDPGAACNDRNACTTGDTCTSTGACVGTAINLDDGNPCTVDTCDVATGPVHTLSPGAACNDGNVCTGPDTCSATGACSGPRLASIDDLNPCTRDVCDPATGAVSHPPTSADATCSSATYYCYDKYGRVSRTVVCVAGQACDQTCP